MKLSSRLSRIGESATLRVARKALELKQQGVEVADLSAGEPDFPSPAAALEAAKRALDSGMTRYTPAAGIAELRDAIAEKHCAGGGPWSGGDVVVTVGAKAALIELILALFGEGDEVIVPRPYWVSFPEQIRFAGAEPVFVDADRDHGFRLRAEPILAAITDRTRGVILNSPCNPTGGVIGEDDLRKLVEGCAERNVVVISDETYERFVYDGVRHASIAAVARQYPEHSILVGSFSKTYAMTGWRLGYLLGPAAVVKAVSVVQSHATSNPTSFAMPGAVAALRDAEAEVSEMLAEYAVRRDLTARLLREIPGVECAPPDGAFYAFPAVSRCFAAGRQGSVEFAEFLLEAARVAVVPGIAFGDDRHIRISFACSRETLEQGLVRVAEALTA